MVKIWVKTIRGEKTTRSEVFVFSGKYEEAEFQDYLNEICDQLDIPTPVVIKAHVRNFSRFNITKFKRDDFVESTDFDLLSLENAADK